MKIITKEIEKKFEKHPWGSQDGKGKDAEVLLKVFNPYGGQTWLITEAWKEDGKWMGFGYAKLFNDWEAGYISIHELTEMNVKVFSVMLPLERDAHCDGMTVGELMD